MSIAEGPFPCDVLLKLGRRSRVIRTLPSLVEKPSTTLPVALAPPNKTKQFINRQLNLRGNLKDVRARGWERRAGAYRVRVA